ncbi:HAD family hydrolase [Benzoatithermus flavus]|uniref:HAD family phosphatase n=1 Tax=Benzoatithermus flavus TaxID=3108223 RepID=A0ABU8XPA4_9PROT
MAGEPQNVIFDLGGVLIDWNPRHLYRRMFDGDEAAMERFLSEICTPDWNLGFDAGRPWTEGIAELVARHPHEKERIEAYRSRWLEMIGGPIAGTVRLLEELDARDVPLYALTNWSVETFALVRPDPTYAFLDRFRTIFVSGELGLIKPDPAIYRHALGAIGAPPDRCLFIDDSAKNVAAAAELGLLVHHFTSPERLRADLERYGLLPEPGQG